ncbi:MAG: hypothetical protein C4583_09925 [Anaerolineaceae bacterium]|jgi:hypothetical protein|nr:MAG: hypothetical protein C4583_09925 [Anaerolineaceae bacterium]
MISSLSYQPQLQMKVAPIEASNGLSRVFAAAVVNRQFCQMLLQDPYYALQNGYLGETFKLSDEERDLIVSIRAESLSDFARQINFVLGNQA